MKRSKIERLGKQRKQRREARALFRANVLLRTGGRCERCTKYVGYGGLHAHHRVMRSLGGSDIAATNGAGLCVWCHTLIHDHNVPDWRKWFKPRETGDDDDEILF